MKTLRFNRMTMLVAALVFLGNVQLYAQKDQMKGNRGHGTSCNIPDLTEEQQKKIDDLRTVHQKEMLQFRNQMQEKRAKLNTLTTADKADMASINSTIDEIGSLRTRMMKNKEAHRQQVRSLLTEKQRIYYDTKKRHGNVKGYGHGMGRGTGMGHCSGR